jgi:hypothetical protein
MYCFKSLIFHLFQSVITLKYETARRYLALSLPPFAMCSNEIAPRNKKIFSRCGPFGKTTVYTRSACCGISRGFRSCIDYGKNSAGYRNTIKREMFGHSMQNRSGRLDGASLWGTESQRTGRVFRHRQRYGSGFRVCLNCLQLFEQCGA